MLRITADGNTHSTRLFDSVTGQEIGCQFISGVSLMFSAGFNPYWEAQVNFTPAEFDVGARFRCSPEMLGRVRNLRDFLNRESEPGGALHEKGELG